MNEGSLREALDKKLNKKEKEHLKTAFDIIGDIAIIEIDDELKHKEKIVAETLLKLHKNINVVCRKSGIHEGVFRTQKLKVLAGEDRKDTICKENNVQIKLDAEQVYFSPRLSTERKRISEMVKPNESVLAMFSGAGPYPLVLLRKEPTLMIKSVEINPNGVKYQEENLILNKSIVKKMVPGFRYGNREYLSYDIKRRIQVYQGDVKQIVPTFRDGRFGLKSSIDEKEINSRLKEHPAFIELHLFKDDLEKRFEVLENMILSLQEKEIDVMIHAPEKFYDKELSLMTDDKEILANYSMMLSRFDGLMKRYLNVIGVIIHPSIDDSDMEDDVEVLIRNLKKMKKNYPDLFDILYVENLQLGFFSEEDMLKVAKAGFNICFDINHHYGVYKDDVRVIDFLIELKKLTKVHFHIADSSGDTFGKPHSFEIGKGKIQFSNFIEYVDSGSIEVECADYLKPVEMINSYHKVLDMRGQQRFDRILMPLPKSAEDFLDTALLASKKGTMIHFYDFLHVDDFYQAREKIEKACAKNGVGFEIMNLVKCGQHAPRVFRICVDFVVK